jgi:hypothetical protein
MAAAHKIVSEAVKRTSLVESLFMAKLLEKGGVLTLWDKFETTGALNLGRETELRADSMPGPDKILLYCAGLSDKANFID